ncbi:MAG: hypothetical protein JMDDDDMK_03369 [Acidobacteria bacterium]|nr:hypothetical protein [Acidobacteriota bacterium]
MHCPNCGTKAPSEQKFCRACGFGLEKVAKLIAEQTTISEDQTEESSPAHSDDRLRKLEKWAARALLALGGLFGGLMLWAIIVKVMIEKGDIFTGIGILLFLATVVLYPLWVHLRSEREKSASTQPKQQQRLPQAEETAKMLSEPNLGTAASVTEHTTAKLGGRVITQVDKP